MGVLSFFLSFFPFHYSILSTFSIFLVSFLSFLPLTLRTSNYKIIYEILFLGYFNQLGEYMIKYYKFDEIADIFTGIRVKRYQKGITVEKKILKKTYEDSSRIETDDVEVSEDINPKFYSRKDDIVILLAGSTVSKLEEEGIIIPMYYAVVRVKEGFDVDFIYHLLKSDIFPRELHKIVEGTTLKIIKTKPLT